MRIRLALALCLAVAWTEPAGAIAAPLCCACLQVDEATTQGRLETALFCGTAPDGSPQLEALEIECEELDSELYCTAQTDPSCPAQLLEEQIVCPAEAAAGVPAVTPIGLAALAALLAGLGAGAAARRRQT